MYSPQIFVETDPERIQSLIDVYPLGMLVTSTQGVPEVSHLPFVYQREGRHAPGKLLGHMARMNSQWQDFSKEREVLVVFQGPNAYVSPSWYDAPGVPTWNYAVVHVRGTPRLVQDESVLTAMLDQLTRVHEASMPDPWPFDVEGGRHAKLLTMIVGFEIEITQIHAKFKLSQNRSTEDQQRVAAHLKLSSCQTDNAVAALMVGL
ncbi:MAG: FMN-binding negative transcriptional regulator [Halothiobacillus sp.]